jgi:hypothetical protein
MTELTGEVAGVSGMILLGMWLIYAQRFMISSVSRTPSSGRSGTWENSFSTTNGSMNNSS